MERLRLGLFGLLLASLVVSCSPEILDEELEGGFSISGCEFGRVAYNEVGTASCTLSNTYFDAVTLQGATATSPFNVVSFGSCGSSVERGESCSITLGFTSPGSGTFTGTLTLTTSKGTLNRTLSATGIPATVTVASTYPNNGANWMDYVDYDGSDMYSATDTACIALTHIRGTDVGCIHGGEKRKITLTGTTSCTGLTFTESLGVFDWVCDTSSGTATYYSIGLKEGKGLRDLLDASAFKGNSITVNDGTYDIYTSESGAWWTNTVTPLPDNSGTAAFITLDGTASGGNDGVYTTGTIFTLSSSTDSEGYGFGLDKLALVTLGDSELTYSGEGDATCFGGSNCLVYVTNSEFSWIEARMDGEGGANDARGIDAATGVEYLRIHRTFIRRANAYGMNLFGVSDSTVTESMVANTTGHGVYTAFSGRILFSRVSSFNNSNTGFSLGVINGTTLVDVIAANNASVGFYFLGWNDGSHQTDNVVNGATSVNNGLHGFTIQWNDKGTFNNLVAVNNSAVGVLISNSDNNTLSNVVSAHNGTYGINSGNGDNNLFAGNLLLGNNTTSNCNESGGATPGITNACVTAANEVTGVSLSSAFLADQDDDVNTSEDANGEATFANIQTAGDWFNFENNTVGSVSLMDWYRTWGENGSAWMNSDNRGQCTSGETCQLRDWSLSGADNVIYNTTGDGSTQNSNFDNDDDGVCESGEAPVDGDDYVVNQEDTVETHLLNAREIILDDSGDDDGLCETGEKCQYMPHFGAYQGEGARTSDTCSTGTALTVDSVTVYKYATDSGS